MSKDFIKSKYNQHSLSIAQKQQKQLSYFTESKVQDDISIDYLETYANSKYITSDYFLNFVKTVFKTENFLLMYKYLRHPLPSARLINEKVKTPLKRVFHSEDPQFKYEINGSVVNMPSSLKVEDFNKKIFEALFYKHNDILITDLESFNKPYRSLISIHNVLAIDSYDSIINRIAYFAEAKVDGVIEKGIAYIDSERYAFYSKDVEKELLNIPHDLGRCPADYISYESWSDNDVVRKSIFTYVREELEEYSFLKTLQRMVEASSVIPTVTMLDIPQKTNSDGVGESDLEPMSADTIGGQQAEFKKEVNGGNHIMQSGNVIKAPLTFDENGNPNMDLVQNYLNFFYVPIEALEYLNSRIKDLKQSIISNLIGAYSEDTTLEGSKSDLEAGLNKGSNQDKLRELSAQLSRIRERSDYNMLALQYGKDNVFNMAFYGSDFFLETQQTIYNLLKNAPNPIEAKSLLLKSARNRNRFNQNNYDRDYILYSLIPYAIKEDFDVAVREKRIGDITFQYQTRFNYWIGLFEAQYGDILTFWNNESGTESEKVSLINNLITIIIRDNYEESSMVENVQGNGNP